MGRCFIYEHYRDTRNVCPKIEAYLFEMPFYFNLSTLMSNYVRYCLYFVFNFRPAMNYDRAVTEEIVLALSTSWDYKMVLSSISGDLINFANYLASDEAGLVLLLANHSLF